ncbi:hypothetical protein AVEN_83949-2-1, partial [Araneus ventricosus]
TGSVSASEPDGINSVQWRSDRGQDEYRCPERPLALMLAKKKDGRDYQRRQLNEITIKDSYPAYHDRRQSLDVERKQWVPMEH